MKIALVSMPQVWENESENKEIAQKYIEQAVQNGVSMVVFPEMTLTSYTMNVDFAQNWEKCAAVEFFSSLAVQYKISVVFGVAAREEGKFYNLAVAIDQNGKTIGKYAKIHPFSYASEHTVYTSGDKLSFFDVDGVRFGFTICYDLRFAPLYSAMSGLCDAFIVIANWPKSRVGHWRTLLAARAIENQRYCIGINRIGVDGNGIEYEKSSTVVRFDGTVEQDSCLGGILDIYELDISEQQKYRESFPVLHDRRDDLYIKFLTENR